MTGRTNRFGPKQRATAKNANGGIHNGSKRARGDGPRAGYDDPRYKAAREVLKRTGTNICWICRHPIDTTLKHPHPLSWSADHATPRSQLTPHDPRHWSITHLREAHLRCNESRGARPHDSHATLDTSIDW